MKAGQALLGIVGALGVAGYFGYDWYKTDQAKKKAEADNAKTLADRNARNIDGELTTSNRPVSIEMPDLSGLTVTQAKEVLTKAGFSADKLRELVDHECQYKSEKDMKPKGQICSQDPSAHAKVLPTARIDVTLEEDTFEEGGLGSPSAWKRMPDLMGMSEVSARGVLRTKGFKDDEFHFQRMGGCGTPNTVCSTNPEPLQRKIRERQGEILIGD
jgi:hypothetical protein